MSKRFLVQTDFKANDQMSPAMKRMNRGFGRFAAGMVDKNSTIGRSFNAVNKTINRVAMIGMTALIAGAGLAAREYVALDNAVTNAGAKFKDVDVTAQNFEQTLDQISDAARAVGSDTEFSATDAAGALDKMAMAGLRSDQSMALLRGTTDLATVANSDLTTAVDIATDSLGAFNLMTDDAAQLQANLARVSDVMAKTTTTANTSLEDMFEAVKKGAPAFTAAGQSMETFSAFTGVLANAGIKGSEAGTSLRNVMLRLAKPTGEAADILKKLGVQTQDADGNFRDAIDILADFEKGLQGMGTAQRSAALSTVFGARSVTGINLLLDQGSDALRAYRDDLMNAGGSAAKMAEAIRGSLGNQIAVLKSGLIELGLQFVEAFESDGRGALAGLIDFVQNLDVQPLVDFSKIIVEIFKFVGSHWRLLVSLAVGIKAVAVAMGVLNIITQVFGVTLNATPVGKIITVLFLLAAAITWVVLNWDKIIDTMKRFWGWVKQVGIAIGQWAVEKFHQLVAVLKLAAEWVANVGQKFTFIAGPIGVMISMLIEIIKHWEDIKTSFQDRGFVGGILAIGKAMLDGLLAPIQGLLELASKVPGVGDLAAGGSERIQALRDRLSGAGTIGSPETPTPFGGAGTGTSNVIDVNFNNKPEDVEITGATDTPSGVNVNVKPAISF